jgi:hypothetical protein
MSAVHPKASATLADRRGSFGPLATKVRRGKGDLFDHLVGGDEKALRHGEAESLGGLEVYCQFKFCW